jgi:N-acetylglucosaminyldiphosphoundecaprenol N-acetyl-beta-D-mannosaminyltransferase
VLGITVVNSGKKVASNLGTSQKHLSVNVAKQHNTRRGAEDMVTSRMRELVTPDSLDGDDLSRDVYGLFGIAVDAADRVSTLNKIVAAAGTGKTFLISTPNVNFMAESRRDPQFRETLLQSDHCCADGMPVVWISRLIGIPIKERVSGSDLFEILRAEQPASRPMKVFLFGGGEGTAEIVSDLINARPSGIRCVGWLNPGFGTIDEMSEPDIIDKINASEANMLAVFLSAKKAQLWLQRNHARLRVPVRGQFGATINYQAGLVRRAPPILQRLGLEWLWRIKEEPYLWRRYWMDGRTLIWLVITQALPIGLDLGWRRYFQNSKSHELSYWKREHHDLIVAGIVGFATKKYAIKSIAFFRSLLVHRCDVVLDVSKMLAIDSRFFGLLLMLRKELGKEGKLLTFVGTSKRSQRAFKLSGFEFLLEPNRGQSADDLATLGDV